MYPLINMQRTGMKIKQIMDERKISVKQAQEYLGLSCVQSVYHWLDGTSIPTIDNLYALSELFQVPIDAMICGNRKKIKVIQMNENNTRLILYYTKWRELQAA